MRKYTWFTDHKSIKFQWNLFEWKQWRYRRKLILNIPLRLLVLVENPSIETPEHIDSAKSWTPLNRRSNWREFSLRVLWTTWSNKDNINPVEDSSSLYKAGRPEVESPLLDDLWPRAAISVDMREYLKVSHKIIEWLSLPDTVNLSCLSGKYNLQSTR